MPSDPTKSKKRSRPATTSAEMEVKATKKPSSPSPAEETEILDSVPVENVAKRPKVQAPPKALKRKNLEKFELKSEQTGVVYLSSLPTATNAQRLRNWMEKIGPTKRIYLAEKNDLATKIKRAKKHTVVNGEKVKKRRNPCTFVEGWVEFIDKKDAKLAARTLNNKQVGGSKKDPWYENLWVIKYLPKFKWNDLTDQMRSERQAYEQHLRAEELQAAREEEDYGNRVEQARAKQSHKDAGKGKATFRKHKQRGAEFELRNTFGGTAGSAKAADPTAESVLDQIFM
ncbi:RNA-binding ATPase activator esf2 [Tieghemiomyces parasiticus]|uniref:18S rRNA factor 2 n=1 Tax=Tieghemiomyces parasiticus TaxID=78921 RepID=A0A9W8ADT1_9FUNG|nr:RNA-binding ATPase activator esf2 [Tieghemiomyces parasiticus]